MRDTPLTMEPRLQRLGEDFGNGSVDRQAFQLDREASRYRAAKLAVPAHRHGILSDHQAQRLAHQRVVKWIHDQLQHEHPGENPPAISTAEPRRAYEQLAGFVQEDFAVVQRLPRGAGDHTIAIYVAFPSSWCPEKSLGASFTQIHAPVPGFAKIPLQAASMVTSMVERGPYVRFVWTLCADDTLDHHPKEGRRRAWDDTRSGWLRVERQITIPFPTEECALFLIRTYLYPFESLDESQRGILHRALECMPREIAIYKGLDAPAQRIAQNLLATPQQART